LYEKGKELPSFLRKLKGGNEFRQAVEAIAEGFSQMQADLESEKRSMQSI